MGRMYYGTEKYEGKDVMEFARNELWEFLEGRKDWIQLDAFSTQIESSEYTLEELSDYIQTNGRAVDITGISLEYGIIKTESDLKYEKSLYDDDIISYLYGEYDSSSTRPFPFPEDVVEVILEKGISLDALPEKLLFNNSFVAEYITKVSLIRALEMEQEGMTPQDIKAASIHSKNLRVFSFWARDAKECIRRIEEEHELQEQLGITPEDLEAVSPESDDSEVAKAVLRRVEEHRRKIEERRKAAEGPRYFTPASIEFASENVKLGDFRTSTRRIKESTERWQGNQAEDLNIDDIGEEYE